MKKFFTFFLFGFFVLTAGATVVEMDFTNTTFITSSLGLTLPANSNGSDLSSPAGSYTYQGVTMVSVKSASTDTRIYNSKGSYDLRMYAGNSLTFSSSSDIMGIDFQMTQGAFDEISSIYWRGSSKSIKLTASSIAYIQKITFYLDEQAPTASIDTVGVSDALLRYSQGNKKAVVVEGIVTDIADSYISNGGNLNVWLRDIENDQDTIEGYKIYSVKGAKYTNSSEIQYAKGDTIRVFGFSLTEYKGTKELNGGYYVSRRGDEVAKPVIEVNVQQALQVGQAMMPASKSRLTTSDLYAVSGYVIKMNAKYQSSYYLSDDSTATYSEFQAFRCASEDATVSVGDYVTVTGPITAYNGDTYYSYEISGGKLVHSSSPLAIDQVTQTPAVATKRIQDGQLLIQKDGRWFNIMGLPIQ